MRVGGAHERFQVADFGLHGAGIDHTLVHGLRVLAAHGVDLALDALQGGNQHRTIGGEIVDHVDAATVESKQRGQLTMLHALGQEFDKVLAGAILIEEWSVDRVEDDDVQPRRGGLVRGLRAGAWQRVGKDAGQAGTMHGSAGGPDLFKDGDFLVGAVFLHDKIVFAQARDMRIMAVMDNHRHQDQLGTRFEGLCGLGGRLAAGLGGCGIILCVGGGPRAVKRPCCAEWQQRQQGYYGE